MAERKLHPVLFEERAGFSRFFSLRVRARHMSIGDTVNWHRTGCRALPVATSPNALPCPDECVRGVKSASDVRIEPFCYHRQIGRRVQRVATIEEGRCGAVLDSYGWRRRQHAGRLGEWPRWRPDRRRPRSNGRMARPWLSLARFRRRHHGWTPCGRAIYGPVRQYLKPFLRSGAQAIGRSMTARSRDLCLSRGQTQCPREVAH
jgi:hypothetical protein